MIKTEMIDKLTSKTMSSRGRRLYEAGHVYNLTVQKEQSYTRISAEVESQRDYTIDYECQVVLSKDEQWILDEDCNCPYYESNMSSCKHIAATLHAYCHFDEDSCDPVSIEMEHKTDPQAFQFLCDMENVSQQMDEGDGKIVLLPVYLGSGDKDHSMQVEFRIQEPPKTSYVVKNIQELCDRIVHNTSYRYGKALDFVHTRSAFAKECQPMIDFLMSLCEDLDSFRPSIRSYLSTWYYGDNDSLKRYLTLKGIYLDRFFEALQSYSTYMAGQNINLNGPLFEINETCIPPHASVRKSPDGLLFSSEGTPYMEGQKYLYLISSMSVQKMKRSSAVKKILDFCTVSSSRPVFIAEKDLPSFTANVWPALNECCAVTNDGFDPAQYTPARPYFEIYLEMEAKDIIDARIDAVYPENRYHLENGYEEKRPSRDIRFEKKMMDSIMHWFDGTDGISGKLIIFNEDRIYDFLKDGIPFLQERAEVFISDRLKRLNIRQTKGISLGVSTGVDLLQLQLFSTDLSNDEIIEILNKYTPKKKFYRLRNGTIIQTDDSFEDLYEMTENMNISAKDLVEGKAELPFYRAMYLNQLCEKVSMDMAKDNSFEALINKINSISEKEYELPEGLTVKLRPYQEDGFRWLSALKDNGFGGLLADEMGLGKTLQVISLMGSSLRDGRCLVVCPASLVYNWDSEIHKFMPNLKTRIISGAAKEREILITESHKDEILITSYDMLKRDIQHYENLRFDIEIIDEAQYIKNAGTSASRSVKSIQASFRIALTGTPIENRLSELWSIFDYILPGFFSSYNHFRKMYETPITRDQDDLVQRDLTSMISPFVLRRLKKDVLKDLPDKLEQVYYAKLEGEQKKLYDSRVAALKNSLSKQTDEQFRENKMVVLAELTKLRQLCCEPSLLYDSYKGNSNKKDMCLDMIQEAVDAGHKILLFSQFTTMLDELTTLMEERGIRYHLLTGSTPQKSRAQMVSSFQDDDVPVFCISLKAGGTGLNLTAADIVIHYDPWWNTAVENQATDRAHRIGQTNVVSVYRLIMKETIEERILEMQNQKKDLAEGILSGDGISSSSLTRDDLLAIL
ncbi:MAG: DEAD/DEAH box helicase [Erysipelotrichaceae bacterium]|nr:DEAD/DEAH box helicase [Erysipelotrichaceae bacterium]